jgi:hypothetical protein
MALSQQGQSTPARRPLRRQGRFWSRLHFLLRFAGLTGVLVAAAGLVLAWWDNLLATWQSAYEAGFSALLGEPAALGTYLTLGGAAAVLLALFVEVLVILGLTAGRRSISGASTVLQIVLAAILLIGVNLWSFGLNISLFGFEKSVPAHYLRLDWTRTGQFTLPADIRQDLEKLHGETTIVVYQRHKTFGALNDKPDRYDYAAERKTVEKVKDLVDQFREVGPRFHVVVLDVEEEGYDDKLEKLTDTTPAVRQALGAVVGTAGILIKGAPELRRAIDIAPENSIFFHARSPDGKKEFVQQLSFNEFYRLDKTGSQEANGGRGNLVLLAQGMGASGRGVETFANKIRNIDERKPRIGIAVIHEWLTTRGTDLYGLVGLKKTLTEHGFEVRDIVLKQLPPRVRTPTAIVSTFDERELDRLDQRLRVLNLVIRNLERAEQARAAEKIDPDPDLADLRTVLARTRQQRTDLEEERSHLDVDSLVEQQRMTDLQGKMTQLLADCDLLLIPRPTLYNVTASNDRTLPLWLHNLDPAQFAAVRDFVKSGKPILACIGPPNDPPDVRMPPGFTATDGLEDLLRPLGIHLSKQTVLFDAENEAFGDQRLGVLTAETSEQVPPLLLDWSPGTGRPEGKAAPAYRDAHPIHESLRLAARSLGRGRSLELRVRHPRPLYYEPPKGAKPQVDPEFLMTSPKGWNEDKPFPTEEYTPSYKRPGATDPDKGTVDARRHGSFPIGVALETPPPAEWYSAGESRPPTVRVAVIGQSWFLVGSELSPAKERLVLDTCNWLLGRDDLLPRADHPWSFPRSNLQPDTPEYLMWLWGARLGLPVLFAYLGLVVLLARRLR